MKLYWRISSGLLFGLMLGLLLGDMDKPPHMAEPVTYATALGVLTSLFCIWFIGFMSAPGGDK